MCKGERSEKCINFTSGDHSLTEFFEVLTESVMGILTAFMRQLTKLCYGKFEQVVMLTRFYLWDFCGLLDLI